MGAETRILAGAAAGYVLGRTKRLRLAITVASMLAGKQISTDPKKVAQQVGRLIDDNPQLAQLKGEITGELLTAAQSAATAVLTNRMNTLSDTLHERSDALRGLAAEAEEIEGEVLPSGDEETPEDDGQEEGEETTEEEPQQAEEPAAEEETSSTTSSARRSTSRTSTAKKAPAKKAPTKKSTTKKAPAKKSTAKKAPAKKTTAKKAPAKKTASKSTARREQR